MHYEQNRLAGASRHKAAQILRSFSITVNPDGAVTAGLRDVEPAEGFAHSGGLART